MIRLALCREGSLFSPDRACLVGGRSPKLDREKGPLGVRAGPRGHAGLSSAGAGASDTSRRPRSLAMWPNPRFAAASCAAVHSQEGLHWSAACPDQLESPCCLRTLNLQRADTL